jgi:flagellar biosynthetic protein FliR
VTPYSLTLPIGPVVAFLLIATRVLAVLATSPVMSARSAPTQVRLGLGLFTAIVLVPILGHDQTTPVEVTWTSLAGEAIVGALAGFAASLVYAALQLGTGLLDIQAGFAMASVYDPAFGNNGALLERFYSALATLLFFQTNAHYLLLLALRQLFVIVPLGTFNPASLRPDALATLAGGMFQVALGLVLPVAGALVLADVAMALLARVAPQFNLFAVGAQIKALLALVALLIVLPFTFTSLHNLFNAAIGATMAVVR